MSFKRESDWWVRNFQLAYAALIDAFHPCGTTRYGVAHLCPHIAAAAV